MEKVVMLAYDVGTSGVKASMVAPDGRVIDAQTEEYPTHYAPGGIAEQDPLDWWAGIRRATRDLVERNPGCGGAVCAVGVSGHMLGCIPMAPDGAALLPCMIHSDSRAAAQYEEIDRQVGAETLYQMSGNILDARSSLSKHLWVKQARPDIYKNTAKFLQCKDYIVFRLTGNMDTTDYSDACHGELMDIRRLRYDPAVYQELGLDMAKLPALHCGCDTAGTVTDHSAKELGIPSGIPVIAGGGDGACGSAGAGNMHSGDAYLSLGSTAWIARVSDVPVIDAQGRLFNIVNLDGHTTSVYGTMQSAGSSINWVRKLLSIPDLSAFNDMAGSVSPGCEGLVYLPYLDGERSPVFDAQALGVFAGLSQRHGRAHFARAVLEGVAYALRQIADIHREYAPLDQIKAIGGGMKSPVLPQIIADICRMQIQTLSAPTDDVTSLGVAAAAAVAAGVFGSLSEALAHIRVKEVIDPAEEREEYLRGYQAYLQIYPGLKQAMHLLAQ